MKVLFIHPNFPAQFRHMAARLAQFSENQVVFACTNARPEWDIANVRKVQFGTRFQPPADGHRLANFYERAVAQGEAGYVLCRKLVQSGFMPDVVVGHSGWGATMYVRDALPTTPFVGYFEWYYNAQGADVGFDPAEKVGETHRMNLRTRNAVILNDLEACCIGQLPTRWQASQFPVRYHDKLAVRHDGVDTGFFAPLPAAELEKGLVLPGLDLTGVREIVTYATRGMEPYRGFPQFMEALPRILAERPNAHVLVVGEDRVCYGKPPAQGGSWKSLMLEKLKGTAGMDRVHFTGPLPYGQYRLVLQHSLAHVYLTRPFVLSWSMLEAMSCGVPLIASATAPVEEVVEHERNGLLVDFFSADAVAAAVCKALAEPAAMLPMRRQARKTILERFSLERLLPGNIRLVTEAAQGRFAPR
ncbi:glycosyltransferase [Desulfovibrio subterraneus]|uniref:glycosyltransferase n=1 Tax=Desulfovibrio subterraneus TaxID=2718620 RepID=UPI0022B871F8|nr:glycosyltransferase [Desulfovibrio subterraneus]WBF68922.1 glycosyltransferase [Desulfovibrio subterraneus]